MTAWASINGPEEVRATGDHKRYRFDVRRGEKEREVFVELSGTVAATDPESLPSPLGEHVRSRGRSVLEGCTQRREPPARIIVNTGRAVIVPRDGGYEPGDRVFVLDGGEWIEATFVRPGDPDEAVEVEHPGVDGGELRRDVAWVRRDRDDALVAYRYQHVRAEPPGR